MTGWAFFGSFGLCLILSGFAEDIARRGLRWLRGDRCARSSRMSSSTGSIGAGFTQPQIALGLAAFTVGVFCFIASVLFNPGFGEVDVAIGLVGFSGLAAAFVIYIIINYGVRESYQMVYRLHARGAPAAMSERLVWLFVFFALYATYCVFWGVDERARTARTPRISSSPSRRSRPGCIVAAATAASFTGWIAIGLPGDDFPRRLSRRARSRSARSRSRWPERSCSNGNGC